MFNLIITLLGIVAIVVACISIWRHTKDPRLACPPIPVMFERARRKKIALIPILLVMVVYYAGALLDWWQLPERIERICFPLWLVFFAFVGLRSDSKKGWRKELRAVDFKMCPQCGYLLKGLPDVHTCPECGTAYDIEEVKKNWDAATRPDGAGN